MEDLQKRGIISGIEHIRLTAKYVVTENRTLRVIGPVEFDVEITTEEAEKIRTKMLGSEYYSPWEYGRWADMGEALLIKTYGPQNPLARVHLGWAEGERERMISRCKFLTQDDIDKKLLLLDSLGDSELSREELLAGIEDRYIWKEVWTRETGHMWENYTLLKRTPSKEEYDFADTWNLYPIRLSKFSTETIIKKLRGYKK